MRFITSPIGESPIYLSHLPSFFLLCVTWSRKVLTVTFTGLLSSLTSSYPGLWKQACECHWMNCLCSIIKGTVNWTLAEKLWIGLGMLSPVLWFNQQYGIEGENVFTEMHSFFSTSESAIKSFAHYSAELAFIFPHVHSTYMWPVLRRLHYWYLTLWKEGKLSEMIIPLPTSTFFFCRCYYPWYSHSMYLLCKIQIISFLMGTSKFPLATHTVVNNALPLKRHRSMVPDLTG